MKKIKERWPILVLGLVVILAPLLITQESKRADWFKGFVEGLGVTMIFITLIGGEFRIPRLNKKDQ